jgi:hypothetical protein
MMHGADWLPTLVSMAMGQGGHDGWRKLVSGLQENKANKANEIHMSYHTITN